MADEECERQCTQTGDQYVCQDRDCEIGGPVTALASTGATVFVAGVFTVAGGRPVKNLAQFYGGAWKPVLGGVEGSVFDLKTFSLTPPSSVFESAVHDIECLYVAGSLDKVFDEDGTAQASQNLVRVCLEQHVEPGTGKWEPVEGTHGLGPVLAIHVSDEVRPR